MVVIMVAGRQAGWVGFPTSHRPGQAPSHSGHPAHGTSQTRRNLPMSPMFQQAGRLAGVQQAGPAPR